LPFVNARISSAATNPEEIETVADSILVSSASASVSAASIAVAPSPSVKARVPEASERAGATFTANVEKLYVSVSIIPA
jgi:hypothetical protein